MFQKLKKLFFVSAVNYLIPGVPYHGIYDLFSKRANSATMSSVLSVLEYWGDKRFRITELRKTLFSKKVFPSRMAVKKFFGDNGYQTYLWQFSGTNENNQIIKEIKKFVNSREKIPVMVYQKRFLNPQSSIFGPRVVIGIFDNKNKIRVNDDIMGSNYEFSYQEFKNLSAKNYFPAILAVWPSEKLKGVIEGPNYSMVYPLRSNVMDKLSPLLIKLTDALFYSRFRGRGNGNLKRSVTLYKEVVNHPDFQYFPRSFQISMFSSFARALIRLEQFDEAIDIINTRALPLNENLDEPSEGWLIPSIDKSPRPYFILSLAYLRKGQKKLAIENYKKMVKLRNLAKGEIQDENFVSRRIEEIEELEKKISKIKSK